MVVAERRPTELQVSIQSESVPSELPVNLAAGDRLTRGRWPMLFNPSNLNDT